MTEQEVNVTEILNKIMTHHEDGVIVITKKGALCVNLDIHEICFLIYKFLNELYTNNIINDKEIALNVTGSAGEQPEG